MWMRSSLKRLEDLPPLTQSKQLISTKSAAAMSAAMTRRKSKTSSKNVSRRSWVINQKRTLPTIVAQPQIATITTSRAATRSSVHLVY